MPGTPSRGFTVALPRAFVVPRAPAALTPAPATGRPYRLTVTFTFGLRLAGFDDFAVQMEIAARAGASGYIAGRAVWGDAVGNLPEVERRRGLARAGERLNTLTAIVRANGRPWREAVSVDSAIAMFPPGWYETFGA